MSGLLSQDPRRMSHADLYQARGLLSNDDPRHAVYGPLEHGAFAREWAQEMPMLAVPSLLAAIPAYELAKYLGLIKARSPASLDSMAEAYRGMWQGLAGK